jgi:DNA-directed RNA polymerase subunit RPC12/RpoP
MRLRRLVRNAAFLVVPPSQRWKVKPCVEQLRRRLSARPRKDGAYLCVLCEAKFDRFHDTPHIQNVICPGCGSASRQRIIFRLIRDRGLLAPPGLRGCWKATPLQALPKNVPSRWP